QRAARGEEPVRAPDAVEGGAAGGAPGITPVPHGSPSPGGRGYLPRPRVLLPGDPSRGHVSLGQLKVMSAIERCRTAALGGHVMRCETDPCAYTAIAYNSCRNRHCPKCQGAAAREWM